MPDTRSKSSPPVSSSNDDTPIKQESSKSSSDAFKQNLKCFHYDGPSRVSPKKEDLIDASQRGVKLLQSSRKRPQSPPKDSLSPAKRKRTASKYAPPSKYAHLPKLQDVLAPNLICLFIGNNPGIRTATSGHAYAHPSNLFWKLLHSSGCTDRRCRPEEDVDLPQLYMMGNTNIVERPTKDASELSKAEMTAGTSVLDEKIKHFKPEAVCIVGKSIWEAIWRYRHGKNPTKDDFHYGWQAEQENMGRADKDDELAADGTPWQGAKVFVASSTSGLAASLRPHEKEAIWKPFGEWVKTRRAERIATQHE